MVPDITSSSFVETVVYSITRAIFLQSVHVKHFSPVSLKVSFVFENFIDKNFIMVHKENWIADKSFSYSRMCKDETL